MEDRRHGVSLIIRNMDSSCGDSLTNNSNMESSSNWGDLPEGPSSSTGTWGGTEGWDSTSYGQPHRWTNGSPINWNIDDGDDNEHMEDSKQTGDGNSSFVQQIPAETYAVQTKEYTKAALDQLLHSPEYQRYHTRCQLCWCVWSEQQFSTSCFECGGFSMQRPCAICQGKCGKIWDRDVDMSHSFHEAHWDGECGLPSSERLGYLQQVLLGNATEEDIIEGIEDLNTG